LFFGGLFKIRGIETFIFKGWGIEFSFAALQSVASLKFNGLPYNQPILRIFVFCHPLCKEPHKGRHQTQPAN
jgi:hypothetical protein